MLVTVSGHNGPEPHEGQGWVCSIRVGSVGGMWMGKRKMGVTVRVLAFSLPLRGSQGDAETLRCWILPWEIFRPLLSLGWNVCSAGKGKQMAKDPEIRHRAQLGAAGRTAQGSVQPCCLGGSAGAWETGPCAQGCSRLADGCASKVMHQGSEDAHETFLPYCRQERSLALRG